MKLKRVISAILVVVILISLLPEIEANAVVIDTEEKFRAYVESLGVPWDTPYGHIKDNIYQDSLTGFRTKEKTSDVCIV